VWVQYEDLRAMINLVKRAGRLRRKCGGQAWWESQGFVSLEDAVADDLDNNTEFTALRAALAATSDFDLVV
jgi:hypothetical protein